MYFKDRYTAMGQSEHRCVRYRKVWTLLTTTLVTLHIASSGYVGEKCSQIGQPVSITCDQDQIIRIRKTLLYAVNLIPVKETNNDIICENPDRNNYCRAPTNRSDLEFIGRQSASYPIQAEDLNTHPEKKGECYSGVRSNMVHVFYECVPVNSGYLQSVCSDILWESEVTGYLTSPYFLSNYPNNGRELDCQCELRPDEGSRVELTGLLMNPSSSGLRWSLEAQTESGSNQDLSTQFYVSREFPLLGSGSITLRFRTEGSGHQQPARQESPVGFWLEYKAVLINSPGISGSNQRQAGRVTLICNDPYTDAAFIASLVVGIAVPVIIIIILIILAIYCIRKRRREKGESYSTETPPRVTTTPRKNNRDWNEDTQDDDFHRNKAYQDTEHQPYHRNNFRQRVSAEDYPEKEPNYGRSNRGRNYSNDSYNDKVFLDEVDKKSIPSSSRTGDNDSIAKKSLSGSQDSQADNYSEVNYSPKGPRHYTLRHSSLGRDTAV
ncbi:uncharacterized protein LOC135477346 [Liolophura sinensis]|uniref:uncharacterized protein LOC135477346 n=1 Tax=Liolophura sinensis TaxID=3198878 RepID=UPI0031587E67